MIKEGPVARLHALIEARPMHVCSNVAKTIKGLCLLLESNIHTSLEHQWLGVCFILKGPLSAS